MLGSRVGASNMSRCRMRPTVARQSVAAPRGVSSCDALSQAKASRRALDRQVLALRGFARIDRAARARQQARRAGSANRGLDAAELVASNFNTRPNVADSSSTNDRVSTTRQPGLRRKNPEPKRMRTDRAPRGVCREQRVAVYAQLEMGACGESISAGYNTCRCGARPPLGRLFSRGPPHGAPPRDGSQRNGAIWAGSVK